MRISSRSLMSFSIYQDYLAKSLTEKYSALSAEMDKIIADANSEITGLRDKLSGESSSCSWFSSTTNRQKQCTWSRDPSSRRIMSCKNTTEARQSATNRPWISTTGSRRSRSRLVSRLPPSTRQMGPFRLLVFLVPQSTRGPEVVAAVVTAESLVVRSSEPGNSSSTAVVTIVLVCRALVSNVCRMFLNARLTAMKTAHHSMSQLHPQATELVFLSHYMATLQRTTCLARTTRGAAVHIARPLVVTRTSTAHTTTATVA